MHKREIEARMQFRFVHHSLAGLIVIDKLLLECSLSVPVNDGPVQSPADHVCYLLLHLRGVIGGVTHNHVVAKAEPGLEPGVNPGG